MTPCTQADVAKAKALIAKGHTVSSAARELDKSESSLRRWLRNEKSGQDMNESPGAQEMKQAGMAAQLRQVQEELERLKNTKAAPAENRVPVTTAAELPTDVKSLWSRTEEECERRILYARERGKFAVEFGNDPIAVSFISDQHIAPGTPVDFRRMRQDAELIAETPNLYAILGGDGVDNHIKIRPAALAARSQPHEQWELFEYYLSIFAHKVIVLISGNHDAWTDQIAGIDMVSKIAASQKLCYAPAEAFVTATVGGIQYRIAVRHQYRYNSSFNQGHTVKQWWRMGEMDWDIGCICHHHEAHVEPFTAHGLQRWGCRPGSYQITSSYSRQFGFNSAVPTCPTFILFPAERRIQGFWDVRDAVGTLKSLLGK